MGEYMQYINFAHLVIDTRDPRIGLLLLLHRLDDRLRRPRTQSLLARVQAIFIGMCGIILTGLVAAVAVEAFRGLRGERGEWHHMVRLLRHQTGVVK